MTTPDPQVRAVLDLSAIESYAAGHIHVGEVITEVSNEKAVVGLPSAALAEAYSRDANDMFRARLHVLRHLEGTTVLDLDSPSTPDVGAILPLTYGDMARAHAISAARQYSAHYLTRRPKSVGHLIDADRIVEIPDEDA